MDAGIFYMVFISLLYKIQDKTMRLYKWRIDMKPEMEQKWINHGRDVVIVPLINSEFLITACDSCGGIGEKEKDVILVPSYWVGRMTTRVALMELLSCGGLLQCIAVTICNEPVPTGEGLIQGVQDELATVGFGKCPLAISTEKNITTIQTGIGVTAIGTASLDNLRIQKSQRGDFLYALGLPRVGGEVRLEDPKIADEVVVQKLLKQAHVHDIVPVGSQGIYTEAMHLATCLSMDLLWYEHCHLDIRKSAGPSTVLLFTSSYEWISQQIFLQPVTLLGIIK